jgi:hypothetical protein
MHHYRSVGTQDSLEELRFTETGLNLFGEHFIVRGPKGDIPQLSGYKASCGDWLTEAMRALGLAPSPVGNLVEWAQLSYSGIFLLLQYENDIQKEFCLADRIWDKG